MKRTLMAICCIALSVAVAIFMIAVAHAELVPKVEKNGDLVVRDMPPPPPVVLRVPGVPKALQERGQDAWDLETGKKSKVVVKEDGNVTFTLAPDSFVIVATHPVGRVITYQNGWHEEVLYSRSHILATIMALWLPTMFILAVVFTYIRQSQAPLRMRMIAALIFCLVFCVGIVCGKAGDWGSCWGAFLCAATTFIILFDYFSSGRAVLACIAGGSVTLIASLVAGRMDGDSLFRYIMTLLLIGAMSAAAAQIIRFAKDRRLSTTQPERV